MLRRFVPTPTTTTVSATRLIRGGGYGGGNRSSGCFGVGLHKSSSTATAAAGRGRNLQRYLYQSSSNYYFIPDSDRGHPSSSSSYASSSVSPVIRVNYDGNILKNGRSATATTTTTTTTTTTATRFFSSGKKKKSNNRNNKSKNAKKVFKQQKSSQEILKEEENRNKISSRPPPASLIRSDLGPNQQPQDLILPSGYEVTSSSISTNYVDYKELYDPKIHLPSAPTDWSSYEPSTPLFQELQAQIGVTGRPITVAEYIQQALLHPQYGYYSQPSRLQNELSKKTKNDNDDDDDDPFSSDDEEEEDAEDQTNNPIFGPRGDFVTAPEICQVFGESIQVWCITQWEAMGQPKSMQWVEFGPGRGTLMSDMIKFALSLSSSSSNNEKTTKLQDYGNALRVIHFIEPSHPLRAQQQASLQQKPLCDLVNWKFHNNNNDDSGGMSSAKDDDGKGTDHDNNKPTIHVYWHDSFGSLSAMIMRKKQKTMGHHNPDQDDDAPPAPPSNDEEEVDISSMPLFVVCQEFFDALPVHAFEMTKEGWRERMVDMAIKDELLEEEAEAEEGNKPKLHQPSLPMEIDGQKRPRLRIVLAPEVTPALKTLLHVDEEGRIVNQGDGQTQNNNARKVEEVGQVVEVCPDGILLVQDIAALLEQQGGAAIIVDYGEEGSTDSLRGFWKHKQCHWLSLPGQVDVTADVDFTALKHAVNYGEPRQRQLQQQQQQQQQQREEEEVEANSTSTTQKEEVVEDTHEIIRAYGPITQGKFLVSMGAKDRVIQQIEKDSTSDEEAEELFYALERLVAADQMGTRYKVLAIAPQRKDKSGSFTVQPAGF